MEETKGFKQMQRDKGEESFNEILRSLASNSNEKLPPRRINPAKEDVLANDITKLRGDELRAYIELLKQQGKIKNISELRGDVRKAYIKDLAQRKAKLRLMGYR